MTRGLFRVSCFELALTSSLEEGVPPLGCFGAMKTQAVPALSGVQLPSLASLRSVLLFVVVLQRLAAAPG